MSITPDARNAEPVISVSNLHKRFNLEAGFFAPLGRYVHAVNGVSFSIGGNETYGLVGESGCGKTTTARLLVRMYEADSGVITFRGKDKNAVDARKLKGSEFRRYRESVKYVFQDPARSLNPRMTVYEVLTSGAKYSAARRGVPAPVLRQEASGLLEEVGLSPDDLDRRPAEFSGGQRQRISIARGLLTEPDILICDEVVSALDVSVQGQILNLLLDLRARRESSGRCLAFLFIAHDLKVACYFCDRIGVMYRGEIMEEAPAPLLREGGLHPYTRLLFSSAQNTDVNAGAQKKEVPPPAPHLSMNVDSESAGCAFAARCPHAEDDCFREKPPLREAGPGHLVRCRLGGK